MNKPQPHSQILRDLIPVQLRNFVPFFDLDNKEEELSLHSTPSAPIPPSGSSVGGRSRLTAKADLIYNGQVISFFGFKKSWSDEEIIRQIGSAFEQKLQG
jgi:hypothetical protein